MMRTADPYILIEERREGYVRYRSTLDGSRWEVEGTCDGRGDCLIGATVVLDGEQVNIRDHDHLTELTGRYGWHFDSPLDVPVALGFSDCCPLVTRGLADGD